MSPETSSAVAALPVDVEHPWLGLASFTEETRAFFHGLGDALAITGVGEQFVFYETAHARRLVRQRAFVELDQNRLARTGEPIGGDRMNGRTSRSNSNVRPGFSSRAHAG